MKKNHSLTEYLNRGIRGLLRDVMLNTRRYPSTARFLREYASCNKQNVRKRLDQETKGIHVPIFLIASITPSCNLFCHGCYARANGICHDANDERLLTLSEWGNIFKQASDLGVSFCLLAGGEPLIRLDIIQEAAKYPSIIFPVFTNGTLINDLSLEMFDQHRNIIPIVSIEGNDDQTDSRRGKGVSALIHEGIKKLNERRILFGTSITVTTENVDDTTSDEFIKKLEDLGCRLVFFIEYVPIDPRYELLAFSDETRPLLECRVAAAKNRHTKMVFLSFPGDEKNTGGCLAGGRGFLHINPQGDGEACPFSPYSERNIRTHSLIEMIQSPFFKELVSRGFVGGEHNGGCALFQHEQEVQDILASYK